MNLIMNADDFGRSSEINRAVIQAHREGILTSASLMVGGEAADEAVELARQNPRLAVGLHLTLVDGRAVLPHAQIPHLTDPSGRFPNSPARLGMRYLFSPWARRELAQEMRAQFQRFAATGLPLSHVDGHQHMHVHPAVFKLMLPLAQEFGPKGIRLPREPILHALRSHSGGAIFTVFLSTVFQIFSAYGQSLLRRSGLCVPPRCYGLAQSGDMSEAYVLWLLEQLDEPCEIYFHPTAGGRTDPRGPNPTDLATLLSPAVRAAVAARQLRLSSYVDFPEPADARDSRQGA